MRIIDAHHHLWDLSKGEYPWLFDTGTPRVYGDQTPLQKDYILEDFIADMGDLPVVKSVHVQAEHRDPLRETEWLQSVADAPSNPRGFPNALVAYADISTNAAEVRLEAHCRSGNMRGIRQPLNAIVSQPARHPDLFADRIWRSNVGLLARFGLSLDVQVYPSQMPALTGLVAEHPDVQFILCHHGLPTDASKEGRALWRRGMKDLSALPNIAVKISGFGMFDRNWNSDTIKPVALETIDLFAPSRCMFGSNFPVDGLMSSYARIWESFDAITASFSQPERSALFHDNAARFYRLES